MQLLVHRYYAMGEADPDDMLKIMIGKLAAAYKIVYCVKYSHDEVFVVVLCIK